MKSGLLTLSLGFVPLVSFLAFIFLIEFTDMIAVPERALLDFHSDVQLAGYSSTESFTTTPDGYILTLYRVYREAPKGKPVLLLHGFSNSANAFILNTCAQPLAFALVDAGFDVWLANFRGNYWSRNHVEYKGTDWEYWQWSTPHLMYFDLPTMVKHVKQQTGYQKIGIIGHSQGGQTAAWASASLEGFDQDVGIVVTLASVLHKPGPLNLYLKMITAEWFHEFCRWMDWRIYLDYTDSLFQARLSIIFPSFIGWFIRDFYDIELNKGKPEDLAILGQRMQGGTSLKCLQFVKTLVHNESLNPRLHDLGPEMNLRVYNTTDVPRVDFSKISTKIAVIQGQYDKVTLAEDVEKVKELIPKDKLVLFKTDYPYDHSTFLLGCSDDFHRDLFPLLQSYIQPLIK